MAVSEVIYLGWLKSGTTKLFRNSELQKKDSRLWTNDVELNSSILNSQGKRKI